MIDDDRLDEECYKAGKVADWVLGLLFLISFIVAFFAVISVE